MIDYKFQRDNYLREQKPYKVISKNEIQFLGENIYELEGKEFQVSPLVATQIDKFIGINKKQVSAIHKASGEEGVRDYRNYIAMVNSISNPQNLALIADPKERIIIGATALEKDAIPMESFFDFAEMFANDNNYSISSFSKGSDVTAGIELTMIPDTKNIISLGIDEDFMTNGYLMKWNLGAIEIGHYYERLICSNGAVEKVFKKQSSFHSLEDKNIRTLLNYPQYANTDFNAFRQNAYIAMESKASLAELQYVSKLLQANNVDEELIETIIPLQSDVQAYEQMGYNQFEYTRAKSSQTVWETFNRLTFFASHNEIWDTDDNRRVQIMSASVGFLNKQRDIKEYYDIF